MQANFLLWTGHRSCEEKRPPWHALEASLIMQDSSTVLHIWSLFVYLGLHWSYSETQLFWKIPNRQNFHFILSRWGW